MGFFLPAAILTLIIANLPYILGYLYPHPGLVFSGVTVAPEDGLSYLAKLNQGLSGHWDFHLPFTAFTHPGVYIFTYFLFLGHLAGWLGASITLVYFLARVINGFFLLAMIYLLVARLVVSPAEAKYFYLFSTLSSGLGWLLLPFGQLLSTDLTVPESNTFYTLMDNAHFPLGQALMLLIILIWLSPSAPNVSKRIVKLALIAVASLILASLQPFIFAILLPVV